MNENKRITLVMVDTCVYREANSDFPGIVKKLLPSFFSAIEEKNVLLLTHPILEKEIYKHIEDSSLYKNYQGLVEQLRKCRATLEYADCDDEDLFARIGSCDIKKQIFESYQLHYRNAVRLEYGDPASVFELYFKSLPPFAKIGKKKNEFPDAFVIDSVKNYLEVHSNDVLLVVSKDNDWLTAFEHMDNVLNCQSIDEALTILSEIDSILSTEMQNQIFHGAYEEMISDAQHRIECECFELEDYETFNELDIESVSIERIDDSFIPLKITRDNLLLSTSVLVKVSGHAEVFDADSSVWDSDDQEYIYKVYADIDFTDAEVEVECEVLLSFDFDSPEDTAQVDSFKLLNQGNICINAKDAIVTEIDEDELARRVLREDMGYPRR